MPAVLLCVMAWKWAVLPERDVRTRLVPVVDCVSSHEHTYWGPEAGSVAADPNPRLQAYIEAARRGATVRVLLDSYRDNANLDSPRSNLRTVEYLRALALLEGLDLEARRASPTGEGIHNKMVLARMDRIPD